MSAAARRRGRERSDRRPRVVVVGDLAVDVLATAATSTASTISTCRATCWAPGRAPPGSRRWLPRGTGVSTSVDPQATGAAEGLLASLGDVDLLLPNAAELAALTGSPEPEAGAALLNVARAVVVTAGPAGASWVDRDGVRTVRAAAVDVVDTTGAGDAFDAGLLAAWLTGAGPEAALRAGCAAGAEAVSRRGARPPVRRRG